MTSLNQEDINRLAIEQQLRAAGDTNADGSPKEGFEQRGEVAEIAGILAVVETERADPEQLFGGDDTDIFRGAQLHGDIPL